MKLSVFKCLPIIFLFQIGCSATEQTRISEAAEKSETPQPVQKTIVQKTPTQSEPLQPKPQTPISKVTVKVDHRPQTECPDVSDLADQLITAHANTLRGSEYCRFRRLYKTETLEIVLFTLEGLCGGGLKGPNGSCGNNYSIYMTGVENGRGIEPIRISQASSFVTRDGNIINNKVILSGLAYQAGDGRCCPSKEALRTFLIENQSFREVDVSSKSLK